jgi:hypothetical protein
LVFFIGFLKNILVESNLLWKRSSIKMLQIYSDSYSYRISRNTSGKADATSGAGTSNPFGVFCGVRAVQSFVLCVLSFCLFSFGHCIVCPYLIYDFWLPTDIFKHFSLTVIPCRVDIHFPLLIITFVKRFSPYGNK